MATNFDPNECYFVSIHENVSPKKTASPVYSWNISEFGVRLQLNNLPKYTKAHHSSPSVYR